MTEQRRVSVYTHPNISSADLSTTALNDVPMRAINSDSEKQPSKSETPEATVGLKQGFITIVSLMIGSGIFASAGKIHLHSGSIGVAFAIWILTGCMALCGALCYAELGTAIPGSGGETQYLERGLGRWAAFVFEWTAIMLLRPASISWLMETFSKHAMMAYIATAGLPWISDVNELSKQYKWTCKAIAVVGCIVITLSASISTKASDRIQGVLTFGKVASLIAIIGVGLGYSIFFNATTLKENFTSPFTSTNANPSWINVVTGIAMAMNHGLWAFDGWNNLNVIAGKVINPARTLPLSIWSSILTVMVMYFFVLIGYYSIVPASIFITSETVGLEFGRRIWGAVGAVIMSSFVMASTFGAGLSSMTTSSEIIIAAARKGHLPKLFGALNKSTGTAMNGYLMQCLIAVFVVFLTDYDGLLTVCTFPTWIFYTACIIVLLLLRFREPKLERPYRVWPTTPIIFLVACLLLIITSAYSEWKEVGCSFLVVLLGVPVYWLLYRKK